jgi:tRNA-dihydrouridine synthase B
MGNPFIFAEIKALMEGKIYTPPTKKEKLRVALRQMELLVEDKGERIGACEARKHLAWYTKGMYASSACRQKINKAETLKDLKEIISEL